MSGRFASHTGMQHSFLLTGTDVNLPTRFKTVANHLNEHGYSSHMVGKWHLGFESKFLHTPLARGFKTYFGYLSGGEDYYTHKAGKWVDLHNGTEPALDQDGVYSTDLFASEAIRVVHGHNASIPFYLYLAFQSVHSPLEAPANYVANYSWITDKSRRTLAAMATAMDDALARLVGALKAKGMWENCMFLFFADNGGPPYVANSNWPMRGGKWTMWEGGTHLAAFAHHGGGKIRVGNFSGLFHHCDWAATLVAAAGGTTLNDTALPPPDSVSQWAAMQPGAAPAPADYPRKHVLLNVDQTNQDTENDPGGWSGYAGLVVLDPDRGHWKIVLGNPGTPDEWCWPNQNTTAAPRPLAWPAADAGNCTQRSGVAFPGNDIKSTSAPTSAECCDLCAATHGCRGYTFRLAANKDGAHCFLKTNLSGSAELPCSECVSGAVSGAPLPPPAPAPNSSDPMPDPARLSCGFNGKVPVNRTGVILFNLATDPREANNVAAANPEVVTFLHSLLDPYIASAVEPLNETPDERRVDPAATAAAARAQCWVPWANATAASAASASD